MLYQGKCWLTSAAPVTRNSVALRGMPQNNQTAFPPFSIEENWQVSQEHLKKGTLPSVLILTPPLYSYYECLSFNAFSFTSHNESLPPTTTLGVERGKRKKEKRRRDEELNSNTR